MKHYQKRPGNWGGGGGGGNKKKFLEMRYRFINRYVGMRIGLIIRFYTVMTPLTLDPP